VNRGTWTPEDREEHDAILTEAWGAARSTAGRVEKYLSLINDAIQARRFFARDVENDMKRTGARAQLKRWHKARAQVAVSYQGRVISKPRVIGTDRTDEEGRVYTTQTLFDFMTWDEIENKIREYAAQVQSYRANIALCLRLLELHDAAPSAATPAEAVEMLGTSMETWLGEEAA
jgi:hypothetical protein